MSVEWLRERVRDFRRVSDDELQAISDFSLLWSLFEARILPEGGGSRAICEAVKSWSQASTLDAELCVAELEYFRHRYFTNGEFTHHFDGLRLRRQDRMELVRSVLDGRNVEPEARVSTVLIVIYRYRNNLFHGAKWEYGIAGQLENFTRAKAVLIKILDRHGRL